MESNVGGKYFLCGVEEWRVTWEEKTSSVGSRSGELEEYTSSVGVEEWRVTWEEYTSSVGSRSGE
jgi:hypothetical protein